jgi:hypothetical protein
MIEAMKNLIHIHHSSVAAPALFQAQPSAYAALTLSRLLLLR